MNHKCAVISIVGRPNVGKSTLLNYLAKNKLSAVSPKPQTTRTSIRGIITEGDVQLVFIDSPGFQTKNTLLERKMRRVIVNTIIEADFTLMITQMGGSVLRSIEETGKLSSIDSLEQSLIEEIISNGKKIDLLVINKIDKIKKREVLLPLMEWFFKNYGVERIFPISALTGEGVKELFDEIVKISPSREFLYDPEQISDKPEKFFVSEFIRETIFSLTHLEVPYASSVIIKSWEEKENLIVIEGQIIVEREGQKGILIGKDGKMIKKIGIYSRKKIEKFLGKHVFLGLKVLVMERWRENMRLIENLIHGEPK